MYQVDDRHIKRSKCIHEKNTKMKKKTPQTRSSLSILNAILPIQEDEQNNQTNIINLNNNHTVYPTKTPDQMINTSLAKKKHR